MDYQCRTQTDAEGLKLSSLPKCKVLACQGNFDRMPERGWYMTLFQCQQEGQLEQKLRESAVLGQLLDLGRHTTFPAASKVTQSRSSLTAASFRAR